MSTEHKVVTTHIQHLIRNGLTHAMAANHQGEVIDLSPTHSLVDFHGLRTVDVLEKASADLRHAAEELAAERLSLLGFPQV